MMSRETEKGGYKLYAHFYTEIHNLVHINLTLQRTTKFVVSSGIRTRIIGFPEPSSGIRTRIFACLELSSQLGLIASLIQLKCTKYFRDDLTLVFEDAQCFNSISKIIVRDMKN